MQENSKKSINRLQEYITTKGVSLNKLSVELGLSNSYFSKMVRNSGSIGSDIIEKIIRLYPDLNAEWLLTGNGCMTKTVTSLNESKKDVGCPPFLSPSCPEQAKEIHKYVNESDIPDDLKKRIEQIEKKISKHVDELDAPDDLKENIRQVNRERVKNWISEDYISDSDKSAMSLMWDWVDKNEVRTLYQLNIRSLNSKIDILKRDLIDLYDDYYLFMEAINRFKLDSYSSKFMIPPTSNEQMKLINENFDIEFSGVEDKKLKAVFWILELEQEIENMHDAIHMSIRLFSYASQFISRWHQLKLANKDSNKNSDENNEENRS